MSRPALDRIVKQLRVASVSDRELLARFTRAGDQEAFAALVRRHGRLVMSACRQVLADPADADDAFQATFLVLLRKARTTDWQESLGGWLYAVAHRIAVHARGEARRRRDRESQAEPSGGSGGGAHAELSWREACVVLHEELDRLPDRYRMPLLLCYLEGQSRDEAARNLGWTIGALRGLLERGREKLRRRLVRRGIALSAGLFAAVEGSASGGVPPGLLRLTLAAAGGCGASRITALADLAFPTARTTSRILSGLLALAVVFGASLALRHQLGAGEKPAEPAKTEKQTAELPPPAKPPKESGRLRGRVLTPDGKPLSGAKLFLLGNGKDVEVGSSGADGRFEVEQPTERDRRSLVAMAEGVGLDFVDLRKLDRAAEVELRTVRDRSIRGRVVDTEGRPVAGVRVALTQVGVYAGESLDGFLAEWKKRHFMSGLPGGAKHLWSESGALRTTKTDRDGRFVLEGVGRERLATLRLSGPGVADAEAWVVNRDGFDPKPYNQATLDNIPKGFDSFGHRWRLYGPDVSLVAEAEKPIRGVVREADTGKPRPGVTVWLSRAGRELLPLSPSATTDAEGRYEIRGAGKLKAYTLEVKSDATAGFLATQVEVPDNAGYAPITADIRVARGVVVRGRVLDTGTGKPVPGRVHVTVAVGNPFIKDYPEFESSAWLASEDAGEDGTFRILTIPGPVVLMGGADARRLLDGELGVLRYKPPVPDPKYPQFFEDLPGSPAVIGVGGSISPLQGNFCKVLEIKKGEKEVTQDILLEPAGSVSVRIRDADGRPVRGVYATGMSPRNWMHPLRVPADSCAAYHVEAGKPRRLVFYHPDRKLFGTLTLKGDEKEPAVATLGAAGSVKGRLLRKGQPVEGVTVVVHFTDREVDEIQEHVHRAVLVVTDQDGRFRIDDVIPGPGFRLYHHRKQSQQQSAKLFEDQVRVRPGETLDLGDLTVKLAPEGD